MGLHLSLVPVLFALLASDGGASPTPALVLSCPDSTPIPAAEPQEPEWLFRRRRRAEPDTPGDTCAVADSNLKRVEDAILAAPHPPFPPAGKKPRSRSKPQRLARVAQRFALSPEELALLARNGFVVPERLQVADYAWAFHEIHQSELPLFVSADAILHAVFAENDRLLSRIEESVLAPRLRRALGAMHCTLPAAAAQLPPEVARDVDLYLTVARSLLEGAPARSALGTDEEAARLVERITAAQGLEVISLFGRERYVDFTAYTPRGHYTEELANYFRAATWLSRLELNLASRSCRSSAPTLDSAETPREALDALALAELASRGGALEDLAALDRAWGLFAGKREDVGIAELVQLRREAGIARLDEPGAFQRLRAAIGDRFRRQARLHYMPEGSSELPAIATLLGPRVTGDTEITRLLVHPEVPERYLAGAVDLAYVLGHDRARAQLASELAAHPALGAQLDRARAALRELPDHGDLYGAWLAAVRALADRPSGVLPSSMESEAFRDLRVGSALVAYGQLRHASVLVAGQGYDEGGCEIPDGFVDPVPAVYQALIAYAERGARALGEIDPADVLHARAYFERLARVLRVLDAIARDELADRPLSRAEQQFLAMIAEMSPGSSGGPPTYTGWYFDLFHERREALDGADFIADVFTSGYTRRIAYVGAAPPALGIFAVDTAGSPRVVVGPVARGYVHVGPLERRLDDAGARALTERQAPWARSYAVPSPAEPDLEVTAPSDTSEGDGVDVRGRGRGMKVTVEVLDHHRKPLAAQTKVVGDAVTTFRFPGRSLPMIHVRAGAFHAWIQTSWMGGHATFGALRAQEENP